MSKWASYQTPWHIAVTKAVENILLGGHQQLSWHRSAWDGPQLKAKGKISVYHGLYRQMEV